MDYLFQLAFEPTDNPLLPEEENPDILCWYPRTFRTEITEHGDEVMVTVDTIPGIENSKISVDLVNPETLKITVDREAGKTNDGDRRSFSLHHVIPLEVEVTTCGARATFRNGILDIHLRRAQPGNK
jgi:HSP20 family molecular chaperone IbpA